MPVEDGGATGGAAGGVGGSFALACACSISDFLPW